MFYLARNAKGKVIKGPWGDEPPKPKKDVEVEGEEKGEAVELFEYEDLEGYRLEALAEMDPDEAMFEILDTDDGLEIGILIKLEDKDFAALSLQHDSDEGMDFGVDGDVIYDEDETVAIPLFIVQLGLFDEMDFLAPVFIASMAEQEGLGQLRTAMKRGIINIGIGSRRGLFGEDFYLEDKQIKKIVRATISPGLKLFDKKPWSTDAEDDLFDEVLADQNGDD